MENIRYELFNVRLDKEKYLIVSEWWECRKMAVPSADSLSTTGLMVYENDLPICASWLYQTDSTMAVIGFVIGNQITTGKNKKNAIKFLLESLEGIAKNLGFRSIFFPTEANSIARLGTQELNYSISVNKVNELAKIIK